MSKSYNGHKNYNAWNVNLWLSNDEGMYREMVRLCRRYNRPEAAKAMLNLLNDNGIFKTGDGVKYCVSNIQLAMREL
jgi:hypothetical protein